MLKALEIIKKYQDEIQTSIPSEIELNEAIAELEALNNNSCNNCKYSIDTSKLSDEEYLSLIGQCTRCKHYYNDKWEPK